MHSNRKRPSAYDLKENYGRERDVRVATFHKAARDFKMQKAAKRGRSKLFYESAWLIKVLGGSGVGALMFLPVYGKHTSAPLRRGECILIGRMSIGRLAKISWWPFEFGALLWQPIVCLSAGAIRW